jgi:hypothetical protein
MLGQKLSEIENVWLVLHDVGAMQILLTGGYARWLAEHPEERYYIKFILDSYADIKPGHPLWRMLADIAKEYLVEVSPITSDDGYVPWTGIPSDPRQFDTISIRLKKADAIAKAMPIPKEVPGVLAIAA